MKKIVVIIDCPRSKNNKEWVCRELEKTGLPMRIVDSRVVISHIEQRGKTGKLSARIITLLQCIKAMCISRSGDIVFCWSQWAGLLFNMLPGASKRKMISYNWLTPMPNPKTKFIYAKALKNPNLVTIINSEENRTLIEDAYGVADKERMLYIPDVFDDSEFFEKADFVEQDKYCFIGGRANRDWALFCEVARCLPKVRFVAVAVRTDWDERLTIPDNVEMYYDIPASEYYALLKNAYIAIYPLKENRVSGLVNIVKGAQMGKLVLTTDLPVTKMYYPMSGATNLLPLGDTEAWCKRIETVYEYSDVEYVAAVEQNQLHIQEHFAPKRAGEVLRDQIKKWGC